MPLIDPADLELETLRGLADFAGRRVIEIGAGDGRLASPLAGPAALWVALDNDRAELSTAADDLRSRPLPPVRLLEADGRALPFDEGGFDIALFSWSLCCVPRDGMAQALREAGRVLRIGGLLLDVHPAADPVRLEAWHALRPNVSRNTPLAADYRRLPLGALNSDETQHDFAAATAAAAGAGAEFEHRLARTFEYPYFFEDLDALTDYLDENDELDLASDDLLERAMQALRGATTRAWLVLIQPVVAHRLIKVEA